MKNLTEYINKIQQGLVLEEKEAFDAIKIIMSGKADEKEMATFLTFLAERGETASEITGAAMAMREKMATIDAPASCVDCCGTGGDMSGTYNISTAVALICAACNVPIAKHGNRAASSKSGAADVLEALGVNLNMGKSALEQALREINFCFLMAPNHHAAMKHVVPVRKKLKTRTIFNLLGPLANPAGAKLQLIGIFDRKWLIPMAQTLKNLGTERAWLVHGNDGLDEITTTDITYVVTLDENGKIEEKTISPEDFGIEKATAEELKGGDRGQNAKALLALLNGKKDAYRDIAVLNSAAVLNIHGSCKNMEEGIKTAEKAIDEGKALNTLNNYIKFSNKHLPE